MEIDESKLRYYVYIVPGDRLDVTNAVFNLHWEEEEDQISATCTFDLYNAKVGNARLSDKLKIGNPVFVYYSAGEGKKEVFRGTIFDCDLNTQQSSETYGIVARDILYNMQKSSDSVYYPSGRGTKTILSGLFNGWGAKIGKYEGPNVKHDKIVYKNKQISDIVLGVLDEAAKKGGSKCIVRASKGKVEVVKRGKNKDVFQFDEKNSVQSEYKKSISDIVTRVKILGTSKKKKDAPKVEAVVNGDLKYGLKQVITTHASSDSLADAKKAAKAILKDKGKPKETITNKFPDVPPVRKGDKIHVEIGAQHGDYIVKSIRHNASNQEMTCEVEPV